jgi:hypothetical protein
MPPSRSSRTITGGAKLLWACLIVTVAAVGLALVLDGPLKAAIARAKWPAALEARPDPPRVGQLLSLPPRDDTGKELPAKEAFIVILPDCADCSSSMFDPAEIPTSVATNCIFVIGGEGAGYRIPKASFCILDRPQRLLPPSMYSFAPMVVRVDSSLIILDSAIPPADLMAFLGARI